MSEGREHIVGSLQSRSAGETRAAARSFAARLQRGDVVALYGQLGSGKTQFVKGVCDAFGAGEQATSPTFVILNRYDGRGHDGSELLLFHLDLYRIRSVEEVYDLGYEEFLYGNGITLVEWAEMLHGLLPTTRYDVYLTHGSEANVRTIDIDRCTASGEHAARPAGGGAHR
jgi:tRNA threonylcarbamoyladenosine biosynthesis protein TsaE